MRRVGFELLTALALLPAPLLMKLASFETPLINLGASSLIRKTCTGKYQKLFNFNYLQSENFFIILLSDSSDFSERLLLDFGRSPTL